MATRVTYTRGRLRQRRRALPMSAVTPGCGSRPAVRRC